MTHAIATLLFTQSYLPGVLVLARTLRQHGLPADTKLVVLLATQLTPFQKEQLEQVFDELIEISLIHAPVSSQLTLLNRPELSPTYSKINLFKLTQFDTVLYLDADTLPLRPFANELFAKYGSINESQIVAAPDSGWPDIFNSGLFLFKPSVDTYLKLLDKIQYSENPSFDGADQGFLNQYFHLDKPIGPDDASTNNNEWIRLPFLYNVTPTGQYEYQPAYNFFNDQIKLVHFIGSVKPWENSYDSSGLKDRWWNKFYEFYGSNGNVKEHVHGIVPLYYTPADQEQSTIVVEEYHEPEHHEEPVKEHQYEQQRNYEHANEVLLNPRSFDYFETVQPDPNQWNPALEEPPKDGRPEAADFPSILHSYSDWNNPDNRHEEHHEEYHEEYHEGHNEEYHEEHHEEYHEDYQQAQEQYIADELEVEPEVNEWRPPPIFPWEFENNQPTPERVFDSDAQASFGDWDDLPLIRKIKQKQHQEEQDEIKERKRSITEEIAEAKYLEDQKERLKEIEDRYSGDIKEQVEPEEHLSVVIEQVEEDLLEEKASPKDVDVYDLREAEEIGSKELEAEELDPLESEE